MTTLIASASVALERDRPALLLDHPAGDGEAEAAAGRGEHRGVAAAVEAVEQARQLLLVDLPVLVADGEDRRAILGGGVEAHLAAPLGIFDRVVEHDHQHLLHALRVALDHERASDRDSRSGHAARSAEHIRFAHRLGGDLRRDRAEPFSKRISSVSERASVRRSSTRRAISCACSTIRSSVSR